MPRALIIGTSNCIMHGGVEPAVKAYFGDANVDNISRGANSGTFRVMFAMIGGMELASYDYVFLDPMANEQCYGHMDISYWMTAARATYAMLPRGPVYIVMPFFFAGCFAAADVIERIHRGLCDEFGLNFVPIREVLLELCQRHQLPLDAVFRPGDRMHLIPAISHYLISYVMERKLAGFKTLHHASVIGSEHFFVHDARSSASRIVTRATSRVTAEFGVFPAGSRLNLPHGQWLGFDFNQQGARATLSIFSQPPIAKYLSFVSERPYMMPAPFFREVWVPAGGYVQIEADAVDRSWPVEWTDGAAAPSVERDGMVELSRFYFAKHRLTDLLRVTGAERVKPYARPQVLASDMVAAIEQDWPRFAALLQ